MTFSGFLLIVYAIYADAQSSFTGPIQIKVWKHWQQSWNVENVTAENYQFTLVRGIGSSEVILKYRTTETSLNASIKCEGYIKTDKWSMQVREGTNQTTSSGIRDGQFIILKFPSNTECVDSEGLRIVTKISFQISRPSGQKIYDYSLVPMYVRGKDTYYWKNDISSYSAHAGTGQISVSNLFSGEKNIDLWNGILVKPILNFVDRNTMTTGSFIGLHRHENNQEAYFMESGEAKMIVGLVSRSTPDRRVHRKWEENGSAQETDEFSAEGGWVESRVLKPGEVSVIVPSANQPNAVYFHGIQAIQNSVFWTMGTKN